MTNKEAIEQLKLQTQWSIDLICSIEALDLAISALQNAEKCRWHDLRKNPSDLPDIDTKVEAISIVDGEVTLSYLYYKPTWNPDGWNTFWEVVRWREIEPVPEETE